MPCVSIEVRRTYSRDDESRMMEAVHSALREAFGILPDNRVVRFVAHEPHRFECPPDLGKPEFYTYISIDCFPGRSLDAKRQLYRTIVGKLEPFGIPADHVKVAIREVSPENWGIDGGQAARDVVLGYKVNV